MDSKLDYGEILCTAVDQIIAKRLEDLEYDITKLCTIVDDTHRNQGKYVVSDGAIRFEAYSTDNSFRNGNNVLVLIPNGDYNMQKTIQGRVAAADTTPFKYTSPMDTMIKITNNIFDSGKAIMTSGSLLANENNTNTITEKLYSISESGQFAGFTRLGITADFRTWLNGLDVTQGTYGLKLLIYTDTILTPGVNRESVYELNFSSADMIGNPYQFESYFMQEKVFDISKINNIKQIDVYFYQNGKFFDGNENYIQWQVQDSLFGSQRMSDNLFVDNVKIYLGYEAGRFTDETLMLYTADSLTYQYNRNTEVNNNNKMINLRWIHKIDDNTFELLDGRNLNSKYEVRWFKYNQGYDEVDQYAGNNWELIYPMVDDYFTLSFTPDVKKRTEQIKVVGLIYEDDLIKDYYSDILIFENEEDVPDDITVSATSALSIVCLDGSDGNYFLYDQNGSIKNEGIGQEYLRTVQAKYLGAEISSSLGQIDYLKWYFPDEDKGESFTMVIPNMEEREYTTYKGVDCVVSTKKEFDAAGHLDTKQTYSIKNYYNISDSNNTIRCILSMNGVEYIATKEFAFGKAGTNGSNATFTLNFASDSDTALLSEKGSQVKVKADLYDASGRRVGFTKEEANKIQWSWFKYTNGFPYIADISENTFGDNIILTYITDDKPQNDNYYILKAVYNNGTTYNLEAYLPIPIKTDLNYTQFEGARSVVYNNQGVPTYYPHEYKLHKYNSEENLHEEVKSQIDDWVLVYDEGEIDNIISSYIPSLKQSNSRQGYVCLSASKFYLSGLNDKVCVSRKDCWYQPILILQSQYDFAMLNEWDGNLTIDENNGTILSTMVGAGHKNSDDNTFSGVLIGDVRQGTNNLNDSNNLTGLYGYHHGMQSFSLTEDGKATFGKAGRGQILIDGNSSTIQSAQYISDKTGMMMDLDDGMIDVRGSAGDRVLIQSTSPYFTINTDKTNKDENGNVSYQKILNIGIQDYYLQSNNYTSNSVNGTHLNLLNGKLKMKSPYGITEISAGEDGNNFFKIATAGLNTTTNEYVASTSNDYKNTILLIDKNEYYLKSINYSGLKFNTTIIDGESCNLYNNGSVAVSVSNNANIWTKNGSSWLKKTFTSTTEKLENTIVTIKPEVHRENYLATLIPYYQPQGNSNIGTGMLLDLKNGIINGYDLRLKGTKSGTNKSIVIDSSSSTTPLWIGEGNKSNFNVSWDGVLTCNKVNTLNDDGRSNYAISINENFYVTKGGAAGGSSGSFGSGNMGGFSSGGAGGSCNGNLHVKGNLTVDGSFTLAGTTVKPRYNTFVTGISSITANKKWFVTGVSGSYGSSADIPYYLKSLESSGGYALTGFTLTLKTLSGYYLGNSIWTNGSDSKTCS